MACVSAIISQRVSNSALSSENCPRGKNVGCVADILIGGGGSAGKFSHEADCFQQHQAAARAADGAVANAAGVLTSTRVGLRNVRHDGDAGDRAAAAWSIKLIGKHLGLFINREQIKIPYVDDADENVAKIIALVDAKVLDHEPAPFMIDHEPGKPGRGSIDAGVLDSVRSSSTSPQKHGADDVVRWVDSPATDSCCRLSAHATRLPRDETSLARSPEIEAPSYS